MNESSWFVGSRVQVVSKFLGSRLDLIQFSI